jgi:hypothetical protein
MKVEERKSGKVGSTDKIPILHGLACAQSTMVGGTTLNNPCHNREAERRCVNSGRHPN